MTGIIKPFIVPSGCPFPIGEEVSLLGGGIIMTVIAEYPPENGRQWEVKCAWHDDTGLPQEAIYPAQSLTLYDPKMEKDNRVLPATKKNERRRLKRWPKKTGIIEFTPDFGAEK